jgi:zinc protease
MRPVSGWIGMAAACVGVLALGSDPVFAAEERVSERVFLVRDKPGTPTQFQMIVLAGCSDEPHGQCKGLAHYLEHLVLVGRNPEHKDIAVRFFPDASSNGWTNTRATAYVHSVPAREGGPKADLERLFAFYAARLKDFAISEEDAARERNVVLQEHDWRVGSSPFRRFERRIDRELLPDHPSGLWTIGTRESIANLTLAEAKTFHASWYVINNVYFVVKANIEPSDLKEIAARALAGLDAKPLPARALAQKPAMAAGRQDLSEADTHVKNASVIYKKLVTMDEPNAIAHMAVRTVLMEFLRSRLPGSPYRVLVESSDLAAGSPQVSLDRVAPKSFVLRIGADVGPDATAEALLVAIAKYVDKLADVAPSPEVIERLKRRLVESRANADQDPSMVFNRLIGWLSSRNSYEAFADWPSRVGAVSAADVAEIAVALGGPGKVVTGVLKPAVEEASK